MTQLLLVRRFVSLAVCGLILALIAGCASAPIASQQNSTTTVATNGAEAGESIKLGVGFVPNVQFAPLYVGIEKGFFTQEGINLELAYGFENDYLKLVGVDQLPFMIGSGDQVVLGPAQGLPVRYVMRWYTKFPVVIFAKTTEHITQPADLKGKKIGIPGPFGASYVALRGILEAAGLGEQDISMESIGFTQAAAVSAGTVNAAVDYAVNGPVVLAQQGISTTQIALDGYLTIPANGLVTNEKTISTNPELVNKMVRALTKSIEYTLANPDEAFQITLNKVPEAGGANEVANRAVFDASVPYWTPAQGSSFGATTEADWQTAAEFMQRIGLVDRLVPAGEMFTNEFLSK